MRTIKNKTWQVPGLYISKVLFSTVINILQERLKNEGYRALLWFVSKFLTPD